MANPNNIVPFILDAEGGLSKATTDAASNYPVPDGTGYHTNKGITWKTWSTFYGTGKNSIAEFYKMPPQKWMAIFKNGYWDAIKADYINSQAIADAIVDWIWISGTGNVVPKVQKIVGATPDGKVGEQTLAAINNADQNKLLAAIMNARQQYFNELAAKPKNKANVAGWNNRIKNLYNFVGKAAQQAATQAIKEVKKNKLPTGILIIAGLIAANEFGLLGKKLNKYKIFR